MTKLSDFTSKLLDVEGHKLLLKLSNFKTNAEYVSHISDLLINHNELHEKLQVQTMQPCPNNVKSSEVALKKKEVGNKLFQSQKYGSAIDKYTEGILFAPNKEIASVEKSELAVILANRSACLLHCHKYESALKDIEASIFYGYHIHLRYKVYHRAGKCLQKLCRYDEAIDYFNKGLNSLELAKLDDKTTTKWKTTFKNDLQATRKYDGGKPRLGSNEKESETSITLTEPNQLLKCLSKSLSISSHQQYGRFVVANEDIKTGDTLAVEKPAAFVVLPEFYTSHCTGCLKKVTISYPCRQCVKVVYCSVQCEQLAWDQHHRYECSFMQYFDFSTCARIGHLGARICIQSSQDFVKEFNNQIACPEAKADELYRGNNYSSVMSLLNHERGRDARTNLDMLVMAILLKNILVESGVMQDVLNNCNTTSTDVNNETSFDLFITEKVLKVLQILQCNSFTITEMHQLENLTTSKPVDIAMAVYPHCSYFNHSCDPDIEFSFHDNTIVAHAVRDIKEGDQVYSDYGFVFYSDNREKRREELKLHYLFECECFACTKNWPLFKGLESKVPTFKCQKCDCQLDMNEIINRSSVPCRNSACYNTENLTQTLEELAKSHMKYTEGMQLALDGQHTQALPYLISHLTTMSRYLCKPWREYYSCQATIKQCYRFTGNTEK